MGYSLQFYSLDWNRLGQLFIPGDSVLVDAIRNSGNTLFAGNLGSRVDWQGALGRLALGGDPRLSLDEGTWVKPSEATPDEALAMAAAVRFLGERIGEVPHSSRGGPKFRQLFAPGVLSPVFGVALPLHDLLQRPLLGLVSTEYPSWGGLKKTEVDKLLQDAALDPVPSMGDADYDAWLYELGEALRQAKDARMDLVTLYL